MRLVVLIKRACFYVLRLLLTPQIYELKYQIQINQGFLFDGEQNLFFRQEFL